MFRKNKNIKLLIKFVLVPFLAAWLFYSLYRQVQNQPQLPEAWSLIKNAPIGTNAWKFWMAAILVFFNWGTESIKWKLLMSPLEKMSFWRSFKSVLSGVTLSVNTPNRIGEYGGRLLYVQDGNKLKSIPLSIAGSFSQLTITLIAGSIALWYVLLLGSSDGSSLFGIPGPWLNGLTVICSLISVSLIIVFLKIPWFIRFVERIPVARKINPYITALAHLEFKLLLSLLLLSLFRYIIFILQYLLLLQALNVGISWQQSIWMPALLFLLLAIIPSFAIADLGIRGELSIAIFGMYSTNVIGIIGSAFAVWVMNLFIPALAGSVMILSVKFFKEKKI